MGTKRSALARIIYLKVLNVQNTFQPDIYFNKDFTLLNNTI